MNLASSSKGFNGYLTQSKCLQIDKLNDCLSIVKFGILFDSVNATDPCGNLLQIPLQPNQ